MSASTPTRRSLFAGSAALAAASALPGAPGDSAPPHPDAELLAACARFRRAEAEYRRLNDLEVAIENDEADLMNPTPEMEAATAALQAHMHGEYETAMDALLTAPDHTTPDGLRAIAETVWHFYQPDPPEPHGMGALSWVVVCAVAGRPVTEAGA